MSLSDLVIETATIKLGKNKAGEDQTVELSGISFEMIAQLWVKSDRNELLKAVDELDGIFQDVQSGAKVDIKARVGNVLTQVPALAARVIAVSAGEPELWTMARKLPMTKQLECLMAIGSLTFTEDDSVKNFVGGLLQVLDRTKKSMDQGMQAATGQLTGTSS